MPSLPRAAILLGLLAPLGCAPSTAARDTTPAPQPSETPASPTAAPRASAAASAEPKRVSDEAPVAEEEIDPDAQRVFKANGAPPAVPLAPAAEAPRATAGALADTALGEAAGMKPLGDVAVANLREGQRAMLPVTLAPGECATFIAQGGLGVIEVDVFLTTQGGADAHILAQDPGNGPIGVIGGRGSCYANTRSTPLQAELQVTVRRGAGVVLLRGYQAVKRP